VDKTFYRRLKWINLYPPMLGAGIRVDYLAPDLSTIRVQMKLTRLNVNLVGTHFGGSLYTMCDPWFMLMLIHHLGKGYIVWDKAATIQFLRPGRGTVTATFEMPRDRVDEIRRLADSGGKIEPTFVVDVVDEKNEVVAHVEKLLYVRKKTEVAQ
jgi:acyl-coenzyme A thioesterase PaaI-like protein